MGRKIRKVDPKLSYRKCTMLHRLLSLLQNQHLYHFDLNAVISIYWDFFYIIAPFSEPEEDTALAAVDCKPVQELEEKTEPRVRKVYL